MIVKILGTGCPNCKKLENNTREALKELEIKAEIIKVTEIDEIMAYGIMTPPALVIDEKLLVYGQIPTAKEVKKMIENRDTNVVDKTSTGCDCDSCDHGCC